MNRSAAQLLGDEKIVPNSTGIVYEKIRQLGDGSFSTVSLYKKRLPGKEKNELVALKKLKTLTSTQIDLAINELKILSILSHPNVITYHGSFTWHRKIYIEMEYADAGTLADFLNSLKKPVEEVEILVLFKQIVLAVAYLHSMNVIHRDIKSNNIFMTKQGFIKLGDFGISKMLEPKLDAQSFVGTPFYLCPEICQGKPYNKPCDIWSLGCVLYEMATLHRTFEESNLPSLRQKIIKGTYLPLDSHYSKSFQKLVHSMLNHNSMKRPSIQQVSERVAEQLHNISIEQELELCHCTTLHNDLSITETLREYIRVKRKAAHSPQSKQSFLFRFDLMTANMNLIEIEFPERVHLKQMVKGSGHFLALSNENRVYSWGEGWGGELGHGSTITNVDKPKIIESLIKFSIIKVAAGEGFSLFLTGNGLLLSCGRQSSSCTVQTNDYWRPKLMPAFLKLNIVDIDASHDHVVIITSEGTAYAWGRNTWGKLGLNLVQYPLDYVCPEPGEIRFSSVRFVRVFCGENATAIVDSNEFVWLCGNNSNNKLNLNKRSFLSTTIVEYSSRPTRIHLKQKGRLKEVILGRKHTVFLFDKSKVLTIGCNDNAQLGVKITRSNKSQPALVEGLRHCSIQKIAVGGAFTLSMSSKNVYFYGTRQMTTQRSDTTEAKNGNIEIDTISKPFIIGNCRVSLMDVVQAYGPDYPIIKTIEPKIVVSNLKDLKVLDTNNSVILNIQSILNLYSSKTFEMGEISLNSIYCLGEEDEVYVSIDLTTAGLDEMKPQQAVMILKETSNRLMTLNSLEMTTKHVSSCLIV